MSMQFFQDVDIKEVMHDTEAGEYLDKETRTSHQT